MNRKWKILHKIGVLMVSGGFCSDPKQYEKQEKERYLQDQEIFRSGSFLQKFGAGLRTGGFLIIENDSK